MSTAEDMARWEAALNEVVRLYGGAARPEPVGR
jgi:hypothetical protein